MRQWTIDAFADRPFTGNPAAVLEPFEAWPDDRWMQALAAENNLSETAFLRRTNEEARFDLRWFTPAMEVALCGHATLATAHALWTEMGVVAEALTFDTRSGALVVQKAGAGYVMDFPADTVRRIETPPGLGAALGVDPVEVWIGRYLMAVMPDAAVVRRLSPDKAALMAFHHGAIEAGQVIACAIADEGEAADVVDRFFGPGCGVPEDPATGSARGGLTPVFAQKLGRTAIRFEQAYPGRGARFDCELIGDRVLIGGQAVTVIESVLRV